VRFPSTNEACLVAGRAVGPVSECGCLAGNQSGRLADRVPLAHWNAVRVTDLISVSVFWKTDIAKVEAFLELYVVDVFASETVYTANRNLTIIDTCICTVRR